MRGDVKHHLAVILHPLIPRFVPQNSARDNPKPLEIRNTWTFSQFSQGPLLLGTFPPTGRFSLAWGAIYKLMYVIQTWAAFDTPMTTHLRGVVPSHPPPPSLLPSLPPSDRNIIFILIIINPYLSTLKQISYETILYQNRV